MTASDSSPVGPGAAMRSPRRVRLYDFIRTVHLERLAQMAPADVLYRNTRYDFDASLLPDQDPPRAMGRMATVRHLLRTSYDYAEVNEPLLRPRWWDLAAQIAAMRVRGRLTGRRTVIGAYCIGLRDPVASHRGRKRLPPRLDAVYCRWMLRRLVRGMDRLAFGTGAARTALEAYVDPALVDPRARDFPALPAPCECLADHHEQPEPDRILFVGAFDQRKGIEQLLQLWDAVGADAGPRLHLIGKGPLLDTVVAWAEGRPEVELTIDPPRAEIHQAYRRASVVILLSQRIGDWREQVGLPIVEGLSHGCSIVTTTETGIAGWLAEHGHTVLDPSTTPAEGARALIAAAARAPGRAAVLATMPERDSRIDADDWLMGAAQAPQRASRATGAASSAHDDAGERVGRSMSAHRAGP